MSLQRSRLPLSQLLTGHLIVLTLLIADRLEWCYIIGLGYQVTHPQWITAVIPFLKIVNLPNMCINSGTDVVYVFYANGRRFHQSSLSLVYLSKWCFDTNVYNSRGFISLGADDHCSGIKFFSVVSVVSYLLEV